MKFAKLSMIAILATSTVYASDLTEAFQNGKVSGDISAVYESRDQDKEISTYFSDTAYSVGSVGLRYSTADYQNFSATIAFRAYKVLWEDDDSFTTANGTGDATERFYDMDEYSGVIDEAYIAYNTQNVHVKMGRQKFYTEWVGKWHDAISVMATPTKDLAVEFIWTNRKGRVQLNEYRPLVEVNKGNGGLYKLGLTYKIVDGVKIKGYGVYAKDSHQVYGAKANVDLKSELIGYGTMLHYADVNEDDSADADGSVLDLNAYVSVSGWKTTLGYAELGDGSWGFGSASKSGETVVQAEEGDPFYNANAKTMYVMLGKSFGDLSVTGMYSLFDYNDYDSSEFDIWSSYQITKDFSAGVDLAFVMADADDSATTDMTQIKFKASYKF